MRNLIIVSFLLLSVNTSAQEVIATGGDFYQQTNGSLSFTIGEPAVETYYNGTILTQGFQQDFENILSIQQVETFMFFDVYPNPFSSEITIKYKPENTGEYLVELKDPSFKIDLIDFPLPIYSVDEENENGFPANVHLFLEMVYSTDLIVISMAGHNGSYTA